MTGLAASLALAGCASADEAGNSTQAGNAAGEEEEPIGILGIDPLKGDTWNLARIGRRDERGGYLSKGADIIVKDLWLIDRASGKTTSLLPEKPGRVSESYFLSGEPGPINDYSAYGEGSTRSEEGGLRYYLVIVYDADKRLILFGGSMEDKQSVKLGGPFDSIRHMDMLADNRLAVYAKTGEVTQRIVFDMASLSRVEEREIKP